MEKDDKVMVTGGTGFIGSYILRELLHQGYQNIHAIHRNTSNMVLVDSFKAKIHWHQADLRDVDDIYRIVQDSRRVIHAAGLVSFAPSDKQNLYETNVQGTETIVNACLENHVPRLVHLSSIAALAKSPNGKSITEKTGWVDNSQTSHYGRTKHLGEMEVWRGTAEGFDAVILNPSIVLGAGDWNSSSCRLFMEIYNGLKFYTPGSTGFVDVRDVARITVSSITYIPVNERYILNNDNYSFKDVFTWMAHGLDVQPPSIQAPGWVAKTLVLWESLKTIFTNDRPVITADSVRNAYEMYRYSSQKIKSLGYSFTPIEQTIRETTNLLREASKNDFPPLLLRPLSVPLSNNDV